MPVKKKTSVKSKQLEKVVVKTEKAKETVAKDIKQQENSNVETHKKMGDDQTESKENDVSRQTSSQISPKMDMQMMGLFQSLMPPQANGQMINNYGSQVAPVMVPVHPNDVKRIEAEKRIQERSVLSDIPDPNDPVFAGYRKGDKFAVRKSFKFTQNGIGREIAPGSPLVKFDNTGRYILKHAPAGTLELVERGPVVDVVQEVQEQYPAQQALPAPNMAAMPITIPPEMAQAFLTWLQSQASGESVQPAIASVAPAYAAPPAAPSPVPSTPVAPPPGVGVNEIAKGSLVPTNVQLTDEEMLDPEIFEHFIATGQRLVK